MNDYSWTFACKSKGWLFWSYPKDMNTKALKCCKNNPWQYFWKMISLVSSSIFITDSNIAQKIARPLHCCVQQLAVSNFAALLPKLHQLLSSKYTSSSGNHFRMSRDLERCHSYLMSFFLHASLSPISHVPHHLSLSRFPSWWSLAHNINWRGLSQRSLL